MLIKCWCFRYPNHIIFKQHVITKCDSWNEFMAIPCVSNTSAQVWLNNLLLKRRLSRRLNRWLKCGSRYDDPEKGSSKFSIIGSSMLNRRFGRSLKQMLSACTHGSMLTASDRQCSSNRHRLWFVLQSIQCRMCCRARRKMWYALFLPRCRHTRRQDSDTMSVFAIDQWGDHIARIHNHGNRVCGRMPQIANRVPGIQEHPCRKAAIEWAA